MAKKGKKAKKQARKKKRKGALKEVRRIARSYGHWRDDEDEPENI